MVAKLIRTVVHGIKKAIRVIWAGVKSLTHRPLKRSHVNASPRINTVANEAGADTEKSLAEKALDAYRQKLEGKFNNLEVIDHVLQTVSEWIDGE